MYKRQVKGCAEPCHDTAAEQSNGGSVSVGVYFGALARGDQGLFDEGSDAQRRGEFGAVFEGHLLGGVVGVETVLGLTAFAGSAVAADGTPVQDNAVAGGYFRDVRADRADHAGCFVAQQEGEVVADAAELVVQIGVADAAGEDVHQGFAGAGFGHKDGFEGCGCAFGSDDDAFDCVDHWSGSLRARGGRARLMQQGPLRIPILSITGGRQCADCSERAQRLYADGPRRRGGFPPRPPRGWSRQFRPGRGRWVPCGCLR
ncbi:hypothetical protein PJL18_03831 [Paenarthrobacter nicotinovorans]|nr:hypothetical protein [Paenarthrobacter nicotinovorans]